MVNHVSSAKTALCIVLSIFAARVAAQPTLNVVPWNGFSGAYSLTFDDGHYTQLDYAVPVLAEYGFKATFNLNSWSIPSHEQDWKALAAAGHEIGNHSANHPDLATVNNDLLQSEVIDFKGVLESELSCSVTSFGWPFGFRDGSPATVVASSHFAGRGSYGSNTSWESGPSNWISFSSNVVLRNKPLSEYQGWINSAISENAFGIMLIHKLEQEQNGMEITQQMLRDICSYLAQQDVWVGTFSEIAAYLKAHHVLKSVVPEGNGDIYTFSWAVPENFPQTAPVLVEFTGLGNKAVVQNGNAIAADSEGRYTIDFSVGSLSLAPQSAALQSRPLRSAGRTFQKASGTTAYYNARGELVRNSHPGCCYEAPLPRGIFIQRFKDRTVSPLLIVR